MFSKHVGVRDSNEAEGLAILEALHVYSATFLEELIVESDSLNTVSWVIKGRRPMETLVLLQRDKIFIFFFSGGLQSC